MCGRPRSETEMAVRGGLALTMGDFEPLVPALIWRALATMYISCYSMETMNTKTSLD